MKFLYSDLIKFLVKEPTKEELSDKLFQLGHEHEIDGDIFHMEFTPNRGDCLSLYGLSRDLNIFFGQDSSYPIYDGHIENFDFDFINLSPESCPNITFMEIEIDGKIKNYKPYLENFFTQLGNSKVNFFTDISNYVSYELGQPTHCFDERKIDGTLFFENKICNEKFLTLHNSNIDLSGKNCIFTINKKAVSLAGVMGGKSTACSNDTNKVLVECAYFMPEEIIGKSIKYNLNSDAAHKFERGVDISSHNNVLRRFIKIVEDHASIRKIKMKSFVEKKFQPAHLEIDVDVINKILGTELSLDAYKEYLQKLNFKIEDKIKVPTYRHDIATQNDLAEEIARLIGYNNISSSPISLLNTPNRANINILKIESLLVKNGFTEVINYPFTSSNHKKSISIDNPLDSSKSNLRTSLQESLINNLIYNERRQKDSIKLFEISNIFTKNKNQELRLGIIISGRKGHNHLDFLNKLDKDYLDKLLNSEFDSPIFQIIEIDRNNLKTKKKEKIFYTEILIDDLPDKFYSNIESIDKKINFIKYEQVSEFPSSTRDFSFSITDLKKYDEVIDLIEGLHHINLKNSYIFDFYKNHKLNQIKVGLRLVFQSRSLTLSDQEIQKTVEQLLKPIVLLEGVQIPGLEISNFK